VHKIVGGARHRIAGAVRRRRPRRPPDPVGFAGGPRWQGR
jgi:hypothetical protein